MYSTCYVCWYPTFKDSQDLSLLALSQSGLAPRDDKQPLAGKDDRHVVTSDTGRKGGEGGQVEVAMAEKQLVLKSEEGKDAYMYSIGGGGGEEGGGREKEEEEKEEKRRKRRRRGWERGGGEDGERMGRGRGHYIECSC